MPGYGASPLPSHWPVVTFELYRVPPSGRIYHVVPGPLGAATETVIDSAREAVSAGLLLSLIATVKFEVPVALGVPEIMPVEAPSVSPAGRLPEETDHVYAGVPPLLTNCVEYTVLSVAGGNTVVVIARAAGEDGDEEGGVEAGAPTRIEVVIDAACAGFAESVTVAVKLYFPLCVATPPAVKVPEITPVEAFKVSPGGSIPDEIDQV